MDALLSLAAQWEAEAETLARYKDERGAALCRLHAGELREAARASGEEVLSLAEAASFSGYSADHIRHMVASGKIPNAGQKGSPLVRRAHVPIKLGTKRDDKVTEILGRLRSGDAA